MGSEGVDLAQYIVCTIVCSSFPSAVCKLQSCVWYSMRNRYFINLGFSNSSGTGGWGVSSNLGSGSSQSQGVDYGGLHSGTQQLPPLPMPLTAQTKGTGVKTVRVKSFPKYLVVQMRKVDPQLTPLPLCHILTYLCKARSSRGGQGLEPPIFMPPVLPHNPDHPFAHHPVCPVLSSFLSNLCTVLCGFRLDCKEDGGGHCRRPRGSVSGGWHPAVHVNG